MTTATSMHEPGLDWSRIGAWSGSLTAHVAALLLVALPLTVPPMRPQTQTIVARWIEPEPPPEALPEPPPPRAPTRPKPVRPHPVPATPAAAPVHASVPAPPVAETPAPTDPALATAAPSEGAGAGGATRVLAYATPLRPRYPIASVRAHEEGTVLLRVLVDATGVPQRVEIARSSGHARLDEAARDSVMDARFRPVLRDGAATPAWGLVPIAFRLDRG